MSKPSHRPSVLGANPVVVKTRVPATTGEAIGVLVTMTGTTEASVVRQLIIAGLQTFELASSEVATALPVTTYKKEN